MRPLLTVIKNGNGEYANEVKVLYPATSDALHAVAICSAPGVRGRMGFFKCLFGQPHAPRVKGQLGRELPHSARI